MCAEDNQPYQSIPCNDHKITSAAWGPLGEFVIAGHENGEFNQFSAKVGEHTLLWRTLHGNNNYNVLVFQKANVFIC